MRYLRGSRWSNERALGKHAHTCWMECRWRLVRCHGGMTRHPLILSQLPLLTLPPVPLCIAEAPHKPVRVRLRWVTDSRGRIGFLRRGVCTRGASRRTPAGVKGSTRGGDSPGSDHLLHEWKAWGRPPPQPPITFKQIVCEQRGRGGGPSARVEKWNCSCALRNLCSGEPADRLALFPERLPQAHTFKYTYCLWHLCEYFSQKALMERLETLASHTKSVLSLAHCKSAAPWSLRWAMIRRTPQAAKMYLFGRSFGRTASSSHQSISSKATAPANTRIFFKVSSSRFLPKLDCEKLFFPRNVKLSPFYCHLKPFTLFYNLRLISKCGRILTINAMRKWYIVECLKCQEPLQEKREALIPDFLTQ